jgi:hypothetical protein
MSSNQVLTVRRTDLSMRASLDRLTVAALVVTIFAARAARAEPVACVALRACGPGGSECEEECPIIPHAGAARREALVVLDTEARAAASQGHYDVAASRFVCLFRTDPQAETAGSLSIVLREQGLLSRALIAARCAESLSDEGPARDRAQARREDLERRAGVPKAPSPEEAARAEVEAEARTPPAPPPPPPPLPVRRVAPGRSPSADVAISRSPSGGPSSRSAELGVPTRYQRAARIAAVVGAVLLVGSGATYLLARDRASDFRAEQTEHGYTQRAQDLRDSALSWQTATSLGFGAGLMLLGASTFVLVF